MKMRMIVCRSLVSLFLVVLASETRRSIAAESLNSSVQQNLQSAAAELVPLSLEWTRTRQHAASAEATLERIKYPPIKAGELEPYKIKMLCDHDKYYCHIWRSTVNIKRKFSDGLIEVDKKEPMRIIEDEASFDGESCYLGNGMELQLKTGGIPMLRKATLEKTLADSPTHYYFLPDFLTWAGYDVPRTPADIRNGLRSRVLVDLASGNLLRQSSTANSYSIEIDARDRVIQYELSPELSNAVRRRTEKTNTGALVTDATCSDFVQLGTRKIWLPKNISVARHTWDTTPDTFEKVPILTERFQLTAWAIAPIDPGAFVLDYSVPGAAISDATVTGSEKFKNGYVDYRVPASPKDLDAAIQSALNRDTPPRKLNLFIILNLVAVAVLAVAVWLSWKKRRAT